MTDTTTPATAPTAAPPASAPSTAVATPKKYTPELCADTIRKLPAKLTGLQAAFAKPFDAFRKAFRDPAEADRVMAKEIDFAAQAMMANPYLVDCAAANPDDLVNALKNVALTGSTLNPVLKQGYLVPFKGKISFMPSYMGLVDVLNRSGLVRKVEAHPVFEGDTFAVGYGTHEFIRHEPNPWGIRDKDHLLGCYYYLILADGTDMWDTMSKAEIEDVRKRSPSVSKGKSSPWDTDYIEMAKKTLIRRAFKSVPKTGLSDDKLKSITAAVDYDDKVEREWIKRKEAENAQKGGFYGDSAPQASNITDATFEDVAE